MKNKKGNVAGAVFIIVVMEITVLAILWFGRDKAQAPAVQQDVQTQQIPDTTIQSGMTEAEAKLIAEKNCIKGGEALSSGYYNDSSKTWWFDANLNATKEGCNPACVVSEDTKTAEINWRCTGLIPSK